MKIILLSCLLISSVIGFGSFQSSTSRQVSDCANQVVPYQDRKKIQNPVFELDLVSSNGGRLRYLGSRRHSFDPTDPEFDEFEKAWNDFKPTAAFHEDSSSNSAWPSRDEAIKDAGEPGLIQFLAKRDKVPASSLEPNRQDEVNYLLTKFSAEQIKLFYVLRIISADRVRRKVSEADLRAEVGGLLDYFSKLKGLESVVKNTDELETAYRRYWKTPQNWWEAPSNWFNPLIPSSQTGGVFTNEVNQASSSFRDINMYNLLTKATLEGKRVFAIVGKDHIPMQAPALRCALGGN